MNWKNRLKNYNFWISIFSAVLLILQALRIEFDVAYVNEIFTAVLGLLVVIGIIIDPTKTIEKTTENVDSTKKEETKTQETEGEKPLPNDEKNEVDSIVDEVDIQTILNRISKNLDEKFLTLSQNIKDFEVLNKNNQIQQCEEENKEIEEINLVERDVSPVAAEINNPYVDTIN